MQSATHTHLEPTGPHAGLKEKEFHSPQTLAAYDFTTRVAKGLLILRMLWDASSDLLTQHLLMPQ